MTNKITTVPPRVSVSSVYKIASAVPMPATNFKKSQIPTLARTSTKSKTEYFTFTGLIPNTKYRIYYENRDITQLCVVDTLDPGNVYTNRSISSASLPPAVVPPKPFTNTSLVTNSNGDLTFRVLYGSWLPYSRNVKTYNTLLDHRMINQSDITLVPAATAAAKLTTTNQTISFGSSTLTIPVVTVPPAPTVTAKFASTLASNPFQNVLKERGVWTGASSDPIDTTQIKQDIRYNMVQSFYLDINSFDGAKTVDVTEIALYFKNVPNLSSAGIGSSSVDPGFIICIIDMDIDGIPITTSQYAGSIVSKKASECSTSSDASIETNFVLQRPVRLQTGKYYGIGIISQSNEFELWSCKTGDRVVGTNSPSTGSSKGHRGELYIDVSSNPDTATKNRMILQKARDDLDLKFDLYVAEYQIENVEIPMVFKDYEFLSVSETTSDPIGGEYFYKDVSNAAGTISTVAGTNVIAGTGTNFTGLKRDDKIVLTDGSDTTIATVDYVENSQLLYVIGVNQYTFSGARYKFTPVGVLSNYDAISNKMILVESTAANSSFCFEDSDTIIGVWSDLNITINTVDSFPISVFNIDFDLSSTGRSIYGGKYNFSYYDGSNWRISNNDTYEQLLTIEYANHIDNYIEDDTKYTATILSRSQEVKNITYLFDEDDDTFGDKSAVITMIYGHTSSGIFSYESPELIVDGTNVLTHHWKTAANLENEVFTFGNSNTKHISKKLVLGDNRSAEDIVVIYNAYRPQGTDIHVYAKIINVDDPQPFDDKLWTKLELTSGQNSFSKTTDRGDYKEFTYGFPDFPPSESTLTGTVTTVEGSANVTGLGTTFTSHLAAGDVVKIYSPVFPDNYGVFQVSSITSNTTIVLNEAVSNVNIVDEGLSIDKISTPYTAFKNADNLNIVRYFTENGVYDTYNTVAIKTILVSDTSSVVPFVNDYRVIAVSA